MPRRAGSLRLYRRGIFTDLCAGPPPDEHRRAEGGEAVEGGRAYWRGDATRDSLDRLYGTAFPKASLLDEYLALLEEAQKTGSPAPGQGELGCSP